MAAKRQKTAEGGTLRVSSNLDGRGRRANPPRMAAARAGVGGSPVTAGADGSPGRTKAATTIPSDDDDENEPTEAATSTASRKPRKSGRATIDDQPATNRKTASGTALAGRRGAVPEEGAVGRVSRPTGNLLTMEDDDVDIEDKPADDGDDDVDDGFDDDGDVDDDYPKYGDDAAGLADRPFGGLAPAGGTRLTRGRQTTRTTERKRPFEKEASSAQGVGGAGAQARNRLASGGGGAEKNPHAKTGQGVSSADFFVAQNRQFKKEADRAHGNAVAAGAPQGAGRAHGVKMAAGAIQRAKDLRESARRSPTKAIRKGAPADGSLTDPSDRPPNRGVARADGGSEYDDEAESLPHGMADLRKAMTVEGSAAFRFADAVDPSDWEDDWADQYGAFVASLHDEEMALSLAFAPAAKAQTYLALLPNSDFFVVLHGLHRWVTTPPSRSVNEGKLVAFEGETLGQNGTEPPDLLRYEGDEADLFGMLSLERIDLAQVANFYENPGPRDTKWFDDAVLEDFNGGVRLGRLVPIPTVWAAMFLDYPNIGTALRRTRALISSVPLDKVENFKLLAYSMTYATFLIPDSPDLSSVLHLDWKRLPRGKSNMAWRIQAWQAGDHAPSDTEFDEGESIDEESDASEPDPFMATYGGERRQRIVFPKAPAPPAVSWGGSPYGARVHQEPRQYPSRPATTTGRATSANPHTPRPSQPAGGGGASKPGHRCFHGYDVAGADGESIGNCVSQP